MSARSILKKVCRTMQIRCQLLVELISDVAMDCATPTTAGCKRVLALPRLPVKPLLYYLRLDACLGRIVRKR